MGPNVKMNKLKRINALKGFFIVSLFTNSPMLTNGSVTKFESVQFSAEKQSNKLKMMNWNTIISGFAVYKIISEPQNQDHTF